MIMPHEVDAPTTPRGTPLEDPEDEDDGDEFFPGDMLAEEDASHLRLRAPVKPTPEMVEIHNQSHLPFRSWCKYCVRARGRSMKHTRVSHDDEQIPTISIDYGFLGDKDSPATDLPVLVGKDRRSGMVWSSPVPAKGIHAHPHGSDRLRQWIDETGYKRAVVKSDQEPAIKALIGAVKNSWKGELLEEHAPKEAHERSNGEAEITVQQAHGMARTL